MIKKTTDLGNIDISTDVIATICGGAATECYGVVGMASQKMMDGFYDLLGKDNYSKGIVVYHGTGELTNDEPGLDANLLLITNLTNLLKEDLAIDGQEIILKHKFPFPSSGIVKINNEWKIAGFHSGVNFIENDLIKSYESLSNKTFFIGLFSGLFIGLILPIFGFFIFYKKYKN